MELISLSQPNKLFGRVQTPTALYSPPTTPFAMGVLIGWARLHNRSGGAAVVGIGVHLPDARWIEGAWVAATTTFTADTTDAQDSDADDVALTTLVDNDGHILGAEIPFNAVSYDVTTASVGGAPVYVVEYWDGAAWTALTNVFIAPDFSATGEQVVVFPVPADWARGGSGTGVDANKYNVRIRATTAPTTTAPLAKRIHLARLYVLQEAVADNGVLEWSPGDPRLRLRMSRQGDGLCALFSTASPGNLVEAMVGWH